MTKIEPCPYCNESWLFVSDGGYTSGYENKGYKINCMCGYAWKMLPWRKTEEDAIKEWNKLLKLTKVLTRKEKEKKENEQHNKS